MQHLFCAHAPFAGVGPVDGSPVDMAQRLCDPWLGLARRSAQAPFDACRSVHATAVQAGMAQGSLLASAAFERRLSTLERLSLGPWARTR